MSGAAAPPDPAVIAVCPRTFSTDPALRDSLRARYPNARFNDLGVTLHGDALVEFLDGAEKAIVGVERLDGAALARLPALRVVAKFGVGLDSIDLPALESRGVRLGWTPGVNRRSVAELTLCFALALLRGVPAASAALRAGAWRPSVGRELSEVTVGLVGCGHIGREVARLLRPFGPRLLAHDLVDQADFYRELDVTPLDLDPLLARADIVSLHLPLDPSTRGVLSPARLDRMPEGSFLINTARGGLVDEAHLARRLDEGRLAGAAFDVFFDEPDVHPALLRQPTFLGTPHIGGRSRRGVQAMGRAAIAGLDDHRAPSAYASAP